MMNAHRKADHPIQPLILNRWASRALTGEEVPVETLMSLFEAARWAPSSYNNQPWRFLYARKDTPHWETFFSLLGDFNKSWCAKAAVLGVITSAKLFEKNGKPSRTHSFDAGAAWQNLALEGTARNLIVHGMEGFDYEAARKLLKVPDTYDVLAMFAIGKPAPKETLPPELQQKETPSSRKKVAEIAFEGSFPK